MTQQKKSANAKELSDNYEVFLANDSNSVAVRATAVRIGRVYAFDGDQQSEKE